MAEYCAIVVKEIEERLEREPNHEKLQTVYFGGGTPGYLEPLLLKPVFTALNQACGLEPDAEITLETTPQALSEQKCAAWLGLGINRISIGIESLNDNELEAMGRDHTSAQALAAVEQARRSGFGNIALDLMYCLPEQTPVSFAYTLDTLFSLKPEHLSAYSLTIADRSPLLRRYPRDCASYPDEECFEQMYYLLLDKCRSVSLRQYEIANFALPGFESRHNLAYWQSREYLAFGAGAHRYYRGRRSSNFRSLKKYMREYANVETDEEIDEQTRLKEAVFLGLRLRDGIDLEDFFLQYGVDLVSVKGEKINELSASGFLEFEGRRLRLSQKGVLVSNTIFSELI